MKNNISILLTINDEYIRPCLIMLDSLFDHNNKEIDVYLIYSDVSSEHLEILDSHIQKRGGKFYPLPAQDALFTGVYAFGRDFPKEIFFRLMSPVLLPKELERVLYLDVDILIRGDLSPLYNLDFQGKALAGAINDNDRMPRDSKYINSGVLLFNLKKMRLTVSIKDIVNLALSDIKGYFGDGLTDQDIINIYFRDDILIIPDIYNYHPPDAFGNNRICYSLPNGVRRSSVVIVHYYGSIKPWQYKYHNVFCVEYHRYLKEQMRKSEWILFACQWGAWSELCLFMFLLKSMLLKLSPKFYLWLRKYYRIVKTALLDQRPKTKQV